MNSTSSVQVVHLRTENRLNPLGIDTIAPRISWQLQSTRPGARSLKQTAYRVLAASSQTLLAQEKGDLWDSGKMASSHSVLVPYAGKRLASQQAVWWKVRVWDQDDKPSSWSDAAMWSMGMLAATDWKGDWIGIHGGDAPPEELQGAHWIASKSAGQGTRWFRGQFDISLKNPISYALFVAEGSGEVTAYLNGQKINPIFGSFPKGYVSQNVSEMIHVGMNHIAIEVRSDTFTPAIIAGITLDRQDGHIDYIQTDENWRVTDKQEKNWEQPRSGFGGATWEAAKTVTGMTLPVPLGERTRLASRMLRKEFTVERVPLSAHVYISGLGYYELYINGRKVGNDVLAPGLTDYDKRVFYVTYEVTKYLHPGKNAIGVMLGNGRFYAPRLNIPIRTRTFGYPKVRLQLEIDSTHGHTTLATDETWKATADGPVRANSEYDGEEYDARKEKSGWATPGYNDSGWQAAEKMAPPGGTVHAQMNEPIQVTRELHPVKMTQTRPGVYVFDMGQTMAGWSKLRVTGRAGTKITLRYAETLLPNGALYPDNLRSARQTDIYTLKGGGPEVYEPRFTLHGYRYVEVRGYPGTPTLASITGRVVSDALEENVDFTTSNETINDIYRIAVWSARANYHSIPTDCPQRDERQGWLGDRSAESKGESYTFNVESFYTKWLNDIDDSIDKDGRINDVAPAYWPIYSENVVWPASFFIVAEMLHRQYADDKPIRDHYPSMRRWIEHMRTLVKDRLLPVDTYGDWCVPPRTLSLVTDTDPAATTSREVLGSTYFYYLLTLMSHFAEIGGHPQDKQEYDAVAASMKAAFNKKYFNERTNLYDNGSQTSSILALTFGLVPQDRREAVARNLVESIEHHTHGHVGVGIVGGQWLMQQLSYSGHIDVAYQLATQTTYPSWGYMLSQHATTVWELWNGDVAGPSMNSGNHLMLLGDLITWMYENLAGIRPDENAPGFQQIVIAPMTPTGLRFVRASHNSPYGRIGTSWQNEDGHFTLHVIIPPNTMAKVIVPTRNRSSVREGTATPENERDIKLVEERPGAVVYQVGSGEYTFTSAVTLSQNTLVAEVK